MSLSDYQYQSQMGANGDVYAHNSLGWYDLTASYFGATPAYATAAQAMAGGTAGLTAGHPAAGAGTGTGASTAAPTSGKIDPAQLGVDVRSLLGNVSQPAPGQDQYSAALSSMMSGNFSSSDPSYQWRLDQGQQAVERSSAAKGLLGSGNVLTALTDYAQGAASQEYSAQFSRLLSASQNATSQYDSAINAFAKMAGVDLGQQQQNLAVNSEADQYSLGLGNLGVAQGNLGLKQSEFGYQKALQSGKDQAAYDALQSYNARLTTGDTGSGSGGSSSDGYTIYGYNGPYGNVTTPSAGATNGGDFMGYSSGTGSWASSSGGSGDFGGGA